MTNLKQEYGFDDDYEEYGVVNQSTGEVKEYKGGARNGGYPRQSQR